MEYTNIDSDVTSADNTHPFVLDTTVIASTCKRTYLMADEDAYTQTCSVDGTLKLPGCISECHCQPNLFSLHASEISLQSVTLLL